VRTKTIEEIPPGDHPRIALDLVDGTFDLGVLPNDKPSKREMPIRNEGTAPLEIRQLASSCGCTKAKLDEKDKTIPAGGQVMVELTVNPKAIRGFESTKLVTIISNDPRNRVTKVKVHAKVDPEFELTPASVDLGTVEKGQVEKFTMRLRQVGEERIELRDIEVRKAVTGELALSFEPVPEEEWQAPGRPEYIVTGKLDTEAAPVGPYAGYFFLVTTCQRVPRLNCVVSAHVHSFFNVKPKAVPIYAARAGQSDAVVVEVLGDVPITLEDLAVTGEGIMATATPGDDPKLVRVQLGFAEDARPGRKEERLTFTVKSAEKTARHSVRIYGNLIDRTARRRAHPVRILHSGQTPAGVSVRPKAKPETPVPPASQ
jgi:hypothetical protein